MQTAIDQFRISIARIRDLIALHNQIEAQAASTLDLSDLLRSALVLAVSALDYYVHEVVTLGMLEIHRGQRLEPSSAANSPLSAFARFQVSLGGARQERLIAMDIASWLEDQIQSDRGSSFLQQVHTIPTLLPIISHAVAYRLNSNTWLENEIRRQFSQRTFQQPEKIADAIRLISDKKLWDEIAIKMGRTVGDANQIKQQLSAIVDRRNKIAHEADIDPTYGIGDRWPINEVYVKDTIDFIEHLVGCIHQLL